MSLYDEPRPFWEREEEEFEPVTAVAPPAIPEGGWQSLEDIPDENVQLVAAPAVPPGGWKTLEDIPDEVTPITPQPAGKFPEMEVPEGGFKSLSEIPEEVELEAETPKTTDASKWDDEDRAKWKALPSHQREIFLREQNERDLFNDLRDQRAALRDEEFKPPENWATLPREEKTRLQEEFSKNKDVFLRSFDTAATEQGHGDIIERLRGKIPAGTTVEAAVRDDLIASARAAAMSPTRGVWDVLSGISNTLAHPEALARGIKPEETLSHQVAVAGREATRDLVGEKGDELYAEVLRGLGSTITFAPTAMVGGNLAVAAQGALSGFGDGYFEAKEMARMQGREASEAEAYTRAFFKAGIDSSEGIPFARGLDRLEKIAGKGLVGRLVAMGKEGFEEWAQEYGAGVAQDTYDQIAGLTHKDWTDILTNVKGANVAGFTGFLTALLMQGAQIATGRSRVPRVATVPPPGAPAAGAAVPPAIPPATTTAAAPPPGIPPVVPPVVPPTVPPPPVEAPGTMPGGAVTVGPPMTPAAVTPVPPVLTTPEAIEPGVNTPAGAAVTQEVGRENLIVKEVADAQAQNLQASGAPKTAEAIKQVAQRSNAGATVTAAEFLEQAKVQAAEAAVQAAGAAAPEAAAPPVAAGVPAVTPAAAPPVAAAPAPVTPPAIPAISAAPPAATVPQFAPPPARFAPPAAAPAPAAPVAAPQAAVVVGGQVFTGNTYEDAVRAAHTAVGADAMRSAEGGWVDPDTGRFVSHGIYQAHQALNAAIEEAGGNMEAPGVQEAQGMFAEAQARDTELNNQIIQPGGEQVVAPGIKGQEALVATRPSQELAVPLAGVSATIEGVDAQGRRTISQRPAAQALNDARNDRTALTLLLDCLI